jgi:hypothetical protein
MRKFYAQIKKNAFKFTWCGARLFQASFQAKSVLGGGIKSLGTLVGIV